MTEQLAAVPTWTLGDRLRKAREFAGFEQGELAARVGTSRGTVSNYELGHWGIRGPKAVVVRAWADKCGVPLDWIVEDSPFAARLLGAPDTDAAAGLDTGEDQYTARQLAAA